MPAPVVVLDPGHPSRRGDRGVTAGGFVEVDWTMDICLRLKGVLMAHGINVELTREDKDPLSLMARGHMSTRYQADMVVSLHANANQDPRVDGMMCFHREGDGRMADIGSRILRTYGRRGHYVGPHGNVFERKPVSIAASKHHRHWGRAYNVLEHHLAPCILVEAGFATNKDDRVLMQSETGKARICAAIADGVTYWAHYYPPRGVL